LCATHNAEFSNVDRALADHYAVLVWASGAVRDRGGRERWPFGARLRFPDATNQRVTIPNPDGSSEFEKVAVEVNGAGKPGRFDGPLDTLRTIAAQYGNGPIVQLISPGATIPDGFGITDDVLPGLIAYRARAARVRLRPCRLGAARSRYQVSVTEPLPACVPDCVVTLVALGS
jgi:hypothetical protein